MVYEVYYARKIIITVTIGNESDRIEKNGEIPIGFKMVKYMIKPDGLLQPPRLAPNKPTYEWIKRSHFRNPMDFLPPATPV
jgi:hypothetical protein